MNKTVCKCYLTVFIENVSSSNSESHWLFIKIYGYFIENRYIDKSDFLRFFTFRKNRKKCKKKYFPSYFFRVWKKVFFTFGGVSIVSAVSRSPVGSADILSGLDWAAMSV